MCTPGQSLPEDGQTNVGPIKGAVICAHQVGISFQVIALSHLEAASDYTARLSP